jgi:hypothetical protein
MLPFLALLSFSGHGWCQVALESLSAGTPASNDEACALRPARSGLRVIAEAPICGISRPWSCSARPVPCGRLSVECGSSNNWRGDQLLRRPYYAATSVLTFIIQTSSVERCSAVWPRRDRVHSSAAPLGAASSA